MQASPSGWGQKDFERLFLGYGFEKRGTKHDIYIHTKYKELRMSVPRHNSLKEWVAREAVKIIKELITLMEEDKSHGNHIENN